MLCLLTFFLFERGLAVYESGYLQNQRFQCLFNGHCANLEIFGIPKKYLIKDILLIKI